MRAFMLAAIAFAVVVTGCGKTLRPGFCRTNSDCKPDETCPNGDGGSFMCTGSDSGVAEDASDGGEAGEVRDASSDGGEVGDAFDAPVDKPFMCMTTADCADAGMSGVCEPNAGKCVECLPTNASACPGTKPVCMGTTCVQCLPNMADACTGTTPICVGTTCVRCSRDMDCAAPGPGICMTDGHCAPEGEVVYVEFKQTGCTGADGSVTGPYCAPNDGIAALTANPSKKVLVIRGPTNSQLAVGTTGRAPVIIGRKNSMGTDPSILTGAGTGIQVTSDDVLIRDLTVNLGSMNSRGIVVSGASTKLTLLNVRVETTNGLGVQADNGADLVIDRCIVENNSRGGILVDRASFDIRNTTVAGNGPGTLGPITWGGMLISDPESGINQLQLLTVQNNKAIGVSCSVAVSNMGVFASMNVTGDINPTCGFSSCVAASVTCGAQP